MAGREPFRDFFFEAKPILMREPLAETLGAFTVDDAVLEYTYIEVVKAAGHACPTVTGAFLCCELALKALYDEDEIPVRGEIGVRVFGESDQSALGVMAQVFSVITGAAPETGFKGLGPNYRRKDLLSYVREELEEGAACFRFERMDTDEAVVVSFYPWLIPFPENKAARLAEVMQLVITGDAGEGERLEFRDLWTEKLRGMIIERKEIDSWIKVEEA